MNEPRIGVFCLLKVDEDVLLYELAPGSERFLVALSFASVEPIAVIPPEERVLSARLVYALHRA